MGIKTKSLANACNLSEGLSPDIYIKRTVTKQNNVFFIDGECPALTVKYHYYINNTGDMFNRFLLTQHKIGYRSNNKIESYLVPAWDYRWFDHRFDSSFDSIIKYGLRLFDVFHHMFQDYLSLKNFICKQRRLFHYV